MTSHVRTICTTAALVGALILTGCGSDDPAAAPEGTGTTAIGGDAPDTTGAGTTDDDAAADQSTSDGDRCLVLTPEEVAAALDIDTELTSEPLGPDVVCSYTDAAGALVGALQVSTAPNVDAVIPRADEGSAASADLVYIDGVGSGLAVSSGGLQAYLVVDDQGYVWTTVDATLDQSQLEDLMRSIVAG